MNTGEHYLHWTGDQILYTTTSAAVLDDVKLGSLGDISPGDPAGAFNVSDRDFTCIAVGNRNATGTSAAAVYAPGSMCAQAIGYGVASAGYAAPRFDSATCSKGGYVTQPRTDGYFDGIMFMNGVRNYWSSAASWTSPDALGGESPFAYANNNAMEFADPSGFYAQLPSRTCNSERVPGMGGLNNGIPVVGPSSAHSNQPDSGVGLFCDNPFMGALGADLLSGHGLVISTIHYSPSQLQDRDRTRSEKGGSLPA